MAFARRRLVFTLLIPLVVSACVPDPVPPNLATRESFAKSVMLTAASGSADQLEKMVEQDQAAFTPEAQRLVDFAKGWDEAPGDIKMSNDFPEVANVDATKKNSTETIRYRIGWSRERWTLMKGVVLNPSTNGGGAATGVPASVATTGYDKKARD